MITQYPSETAYYYFGPLETIFIIADRPDARELMRKSPHVPVANQAALDLISELLRSKANAEGKVALLKAAIESL